MSFHVGVESVEVLLNELQFRAVDMVHVLLIYFFKGRTHDSDDHVENDQQRNESSNEEDKPENDNLVTFHVIHEISSDLEITEGQSVRVNQHKAEAI